MRKLAGFNWKFCILLLAAVLGSHEITVEIKRAFLSKRSSLKQWAETKYVSQDSMATSPTSYTHVILSFPFTKKHVKYPKQTLLEGFEHSATKYNQGKERSFKNEVVTKTYF